MKEIETGYRYAFGATIGFSVGLCFMVLLFKFADVVRPVLAAAWAAL
jgi:hypothetical protein